MAFNVRGQIRRLLDTTELTDPGEIAAQIVESIPEDDLREIVLSTLPGVVRNVMYERRTDDADSISDDVDHEPTGGDHVPPVDVVGQSWRVSGVRDGWRRHLTDRYSNGRHHLMLQQMTYADLVAAADVRAEHARRSQAWAARLRAWAALVEKHDVETFGDLPEHVQAAALGNGNEAAA